MNNLNGVFGKKTILEGFLFEFKIIAGEQRASAVSAGHRFPAESDVRQKIESA